jgi:hypothetical protein
MARRPEAAPSFTKLYARVQGRKARCGTGSVRCSAVCGLDSAVCSLVARTPEGGGVCGSGSCLHLLAGAGAQSRCEKNRCSLDW